MTRTTTARLTGAALAAALLALPAAASAHPAVYATTAKVVRAGAPTPPTVADLENQTRYAIGNDGYTAVLRESNGVLDHGYVNYLLLPGAYRATLSKDSWLDPQYVTGVQPHATCSGVPALETVANIRSWQEDPFYDYIPWQTTTAGFGDEPSAWLPVVKTLTGVDLATEASPSAACARIGGTYHAADAVQSSSAAFSSAVIADAVAPLTDQVAVLQSGKTAAESAARSAQAATAAAQGSAAQAASEARGRAASLQAQVDKLTLAAAPLKLVKPAAVTASTATGSGLTVTGTGPAYLKLKVRALAPASKLRALGLTARTLGTATAAVDASGKLTATVKLTAAAATALKKGALTVLVDAAGGDRVARTTVGITQ